MSERKGIARLFGRRGEKAVIDEAQWAQSSSASISSYGSGYLSYAKLYRSQPAVRQVVSFIAENMAQVPIDLFRKDAQDIRIEVDDHPVARVLECAAHQAQPHSVQGPRRHAERAARSSAISTWPWTPRAPCRT